MTAKLDPDDLSWLAFRYVADELDEADRAAFEARLLEDSEACCAVARAVELIGVCLQAESTPAADRAARPFPRGRSVFVLPALVAAAAILVATVSNPWSPPPAGREDAPRPTIALELAWASLQREVAHPLPEPDADEWWVDFAEEDGDSGPDPDDELDLNPPHWLLVAVDHAGDPGDSGFSSSEN
jgi:hypothetical protein